MKKSEFWILIVSTVAVLLAGCEKENASNSNNNGNVVITQDDVGIELNMGNSEGTHLYFSCPQYYYSYYGIYCSESSCYLFINTTNNFSFESYSQQLPLFSISKYGTVQGLSGITSIPSSGWVTTIAVNPGTGYVVRYRGRGFNYIYARIYVKSWITNTLGEIIGATIIYQDNWGKEQGNINLAGHLFQYNDLYLSFLTNTTCQLYLSNSTTPYFNHTYTTEERHGVITFGDEFAKQFYCEDDYIYLDYENIEPNPNNYKTICFQKIQ